MKRDVLLRPLAQRDLREIWRYTVTRWSVPQADLYLNGLRSVVEGLRDLSVRPVSSDGLYPGLWHAKYRSHLVFFLIEDHRIDVVRVLHDRMDISARLIADLGKTP